MQSQQTITSRSEVLAISASSEQEFVDTAARHTSYNSEFDYRSLTLLSHSIINFKFLLLFLFFSSVVIYIKISPLLRNLQSLPK